MVDVEQDRLKRFAFDAVHRVWCVPVDHVGYTAKAALDSDRVRSVTIIELLEPVVRWYERGLVPLASEITGDSRCTIVVAKRD